MANSSRNTSGLVVVSRSANTWGQSISWQWSSRRFLCSSDFGRSLEESRDDLQSFGNDTPSILIRPDSYTTLLDATGQARGGRANHHPADRLAGSSPRVVQGQHHRRLKLSGAREMARCGLDVSRRRAVSRSSALPFGGYRLYLPRQQWLTFGDASPGAAAGFLGHRRGGARSSGTPVVFFRTQDRLQPVSGDVGHNDGE